MYRTRDLPHPKPLLVTPMNAARQRNNALVLAAVGSLLLQPIVAASWYGGRTPLSLQHPTKYNCAPQIYPILDNLILRAIVQQDDATVTMQLEYKGGHAWMGTAFSTTGNMVPSQAVIGLPAEGRVGYYDLHGKFLGNGGVSPLTDPISGLADNSIEQPDANTTVLTFTRLATDPVTGTTTEIRAGQASTIIYAVGASNTLAVHKVYGSYQLTIPSCTATQDGGATTTTTSDNGGGSVGSDSRNSTEAQVSGSDSTDGSSTQANDSSSGNGTAATANFSPSNLSSGDGSATTPSRDKIYRKWVAHGILMAIAWAIMVPVAVGSSIIRSLLPSGAWFILHRVFNSVAVLATLIGFVLAVQNVNDDDGLHFHTNTHRAAGLVIFLGIVIQAAGGVVRPHLPTAQHSNKIDHTPYATDDENGEDGPILKAQTELFHAVAAKPRKSTCRVVWEYGHRTFGVGLLALAWYNCYSGIDEFLGLYPNAKNLHPALWGVVGSLSGTIFILYLVAEARK